MAHADGTLYDYDDLPSMKSHGSDYSSIYMDQHFSPTFEQPAVTSEVILEELGTASPRNNVNINSIYEAQLRSNSRHSESVRQNGSLPRRWRLIPANCTCVVHSPLPHSRSTSAQRHCRDCEASRVVHEVPNANVPGSGYGDFDDFKTYFSSVNNVSTRSRSVHEELEKLKGSVNQMDQEFTHPRLRTVKKPAKERDNTDNTKKSIEAEFKGLQGKLFEQREAFIKRHEQELISRDQERERLELQLADCHQKLFEANKKAEQATETKRKLKDQLNEAIEVMEQESHRANASEEMRRLLDQEVELRVKAQNDMQKMQKSVEPIFTDLENLRHQLNMKAKELDQALDIKRELEKEVNREREQWNSRLHAKDTECNELRNQMSLSIVQLESERNQFQKHNFEKENVEQERLHLQQRIQELESQIRIMEGEWQLRVEDHKNQLTHLEAQVRELKAQLEQAEKFLEQAMSEKARIQQEKEQIVIELEHIRAQLVSENEARKDLQFELEDTRAGLQVRLSSSEADRREAEKELMELKIKYHEEKRLWDDVGSQKISGDERIKRFMTERDDLIADRDYAMNERDLAYSDRDQAYINRDEAYINRDQAYADRDQAAIDRDQAVIDRDQAVTERDQAVIDRDQAVIDRDLAVTDRERAYAHRDQAFTDRDLAVSDRDLAVTDRERAYADRERAYADRDQAYADRDAITHGTVNEKELVLKERQKMIKEIEEVTKQRDIIIHERDELILWKQKETENNNTKKELLVQLSQALEERMSLIAERDKALEENDKILLEKDKFSKEKMEVFAELEQSTHLIRDQEEYIDGLQKKIAELEEANTFYNANENNKAAAWETNPLVEQLEAQLVKTKAEFEEERERLRQEGDAREKRLQQGIMMLNAKLKASTPNPANDNSSQIKTQLEEETRLKNEALEKNKQMDEQMEVLKKELEKCKKTHLVDAITVVNSNKPNERIIDIDDEYPEILTEMPTTEEIVRIKHNYVMKMQGSISSLRDTVMRLSGELRDLKSKKEEDRQRMEKENYELKKKMVMDDMEFARIKNNADEFNAFLTDLEDMRLEVLEYERENSGLRDVLARVEEAVLGEDKLFHHHHRTTPHHTSRILLSARKMTKDSETNTTNNFTDAFGHDSGINSPNGGDELVEVAAENEQLKEKIDVLRKALFDKMEESERALQDSLVVPATIPVVALPLAPPPLSSSSTTPTPTITTPSLSKTTSLEFLADTSSAIFSPPLTPLPPPDIIVTAATTTTPHHNHKPYIPAKMDDDIDVLVSRVLPPAAEIPPNFERLEQGVYRFGTKKINMEIKNGTLVVRVGGGYMLFVEFVGKYGRIEVQKTRRAEAKKEETSTAPKSPVRHPSPLRKPAIADSSFHAPLPTHTLVRRGRELKLVPQ